MSLDIHKQAYQNVKVEADPDWDGLQGDYRNELQTRADSTIRTGVHQTPFETEVLKLHHAEVEAEKANPGSPLAFTEVREGLTEEEKADAEAETVDEEVKPDIAAFTEEAEDEPDDADLHKMKRGELDAVAEAEGIDPKDHANIPDLIEAIEDKRGEK